MSARADRVAAVLEERELDALVVTNVVNVRYLSGFTGTNAACIVGRDDRVFLTDFRYVEQARREVDGFEQVRAGRELLADVAERLQGRVGFDDANLSVRLHQRLGELAEGVQLVPAGGVVEELRAVKDDTELAAIRAAAELADGVFALLAESGLAGRTEAEVAWQAEREFRERGAAGPSFPAIVAAADNGSLPHAQPRDVAIPDDTLVVVDMGCTLDGYCSDCTRTFAVGSPPDEALEVYELVRSAQAAALDAVRAGAGCAAVDGVARDLIAAAGHGDEFGHGLGHGVGLEVHEAPRLGQTAEGELVRGNVVTIEPGVYLPGRFGVRIEDLVVVRDDGPEILTPFTKDLVTTS